MKRVALVACMAGVAAAAPVMPPKTWVLDAGAGSSLASTLGRLPHFGGATSNVTVDMYRAPSGGGLYVTRVVATIKAEDRDKAATAELDEVRATLRRQGPAARAETWMQKADPDKKQLEALLTWRDPANGIAYASRVVIASEAQMVAAVTGDCVLELTASPELMAACQAALATLDPGIAPASRVPLAIVPADGTSVAGAEAGGSQAISEQPIVKPDPMKSDAPQLGEGGPHATLQPIAIPPPERESDRRPIYVGAGLVVLAAAFWWNRRRREKFEREDRGEPATPTPVADADSDDLHAAAEASKDEASKDKEEGKS